ncbi:unnamed protein product [Schistosoma rodhaini]|uniref:Matrix-remodeling-associated protein 7 helical domain-containing protein n=1 Tax=Schistosoma mansoni TaxID=6183 RepID=A0A5K4F4C0_SCHMA|nr:unnamed protein product [Schistosoma rodhaini]
MESKHHPSFVNSTEEFHKLLSQCPFMSIIQSSEINKKKINKKYKTKLKDTTLHNHQLLNENNETLNQSKDKSDEKEEEIIIKDIKIVNKQTTNDTTIYLNSLSSIKKSRLFNEFNKLSLDEQNEENELRYKQLNKLYELIQSNPEQYGQLTIDNIIEQMNHFYL